MQFNNVCGLEKSYINNGIADEKEKKSKSRLTRY
jgi:hypothetical protein